MLIVWVSFKVSIDDFNYINDKIIMQCDWTRDKTSHTQAKVVPSYATFSWKKLRHHLILSRDTDDQRILQSDWIRSTSGHTIKNSRLRCYLPLIFIFMQKSLR